MSATLYKNMAAVLAEVKAIPKTGRNTHFGYNFMTADDIMTHLRDLLSKHRIAVFSRMDGEPTFADAGKTAKGNTKYHVTARFVFTLACAETGATVECPWYGEALDDQDKALNKAATAAMKYWLMKTFLLTTGDEEQDTEFDGSIRGKTAPPSRQNGVARPAPAPAPAPAATITSATPQKGQIELVGDYGLTPAQLETNLDRVSWALVNKTVMTNPTIFEVKEPNHFDNLKEMYLKEHENDQDGLAVDLTVGAALQWFKEHREERNRATA